MTHPYTTDLARQLRLRNNHYQHTPKGGKLLESMKKQEIRICECGGPMMWTFLFDGAEYFCLNCHGSFGMLGAGKVVPLTPELKARQRVANDVFKALRKHLMGSGAYQRTDCKKCKNSDEYHPHHATAYEKAKNDEAKKILKVIKNFT